MEKEFEHLSDLSFGHYIRIIENESNFVKLKLNVDRNILVKMLDDTRVIRNEVMHFNPEPLNSDDMATLRRTLNLLSIISSNTLNR